MTIAVDVHAIVHAVAVFAALITFETVYVLALIGASRAGRTNR